MKKCVFCGSGNLTKEHVWPQWLRNYSGPSTFIERSGSYQKPYTRTVVRQDSSGDFFRTVERRGNRTPNLHEVQVKCVCARCNNHWMSKMETQVKPILDKLVTLKSLTLTKAQATLLAAWEFKCFLMYDQYLPSKDRVFSESDYSDFMKCKRASSLSRIYMGWADNPFSTIALWHEPQLLLPNSFNSPVGLENPNNLSSSYLAVQRIYFIQFYYSKNIEWTPDSRERLYHEPIRLLSHTPALEVHPIPKPVKWPPRPTSFTELEASRLAVLNRMNQLPSLVENLPFR